MKTSRLFKVENKLSEITSRPGGRRVADALRAAEARVLEKHGDLAAALPEASARLKDLLDGSDANPGGALEGLYTEANQIFALAAVLERKPLATAAYSLCDVADGFRESGEISWQALRVHVDAIRLLVQGTGSADADAAILEGLRQVGARFLRPAENVAGT